MILKVRVKLFLNYSTLRAGIRRIHVWTSNNIVKSPYKDIAIPNTTLVDYVWRNLDKWPTKTATVCAITKRSYTYEEIHKHSITFGANLRKVFKIQDGDTVAIMLPNMPEYPIVTFGILSAGGVVTTLNPNYTFYEVRRQLETCLPKVIVTTPNILPVLKEAFQLLKIEAPIITVTGDTPEDAVSFNAIIENSDIDKDVLSGVKREAEDVCFMPYSSGTTGLPKGIELTNKNLVTNCEQQNSEVRHYDLTTDTNQDVTLVVLPLFHSFAFCMMMLHKLSVGLKLVTLPAFKTKTFLNALIEYKVNVLYTAPPIVLILGSHPNVTPRHFDHIKTLICGAAPVPLSDIQNIFKKAGRELSFVQGYGLTETSPLTTISRPGSKNYSSVGHALPNVELRVVDKDFFNLGPNEEGELLIKGPNVMRGYKDMPEANEEVFLSGGWFRSGDVAKIDTDGAVTITDRLKELIKIKGYQVPPAELEAVLKEHPSILDAAVIGVPDEKTGERPRAFVVQQPGMIIDKETVIDFVKQRVVSYKRINDVTFIDSIPKNPSGKILKRVLKEKYC